MTEMTSWMMILIRVNVRECSDSRYTNHLYDDTEIITRDTKEELLAYCYGLREAYKKEIPVSAYDSGTLLNFFGPIEVVNNASWTSDETGKIEHWFEEHSVTDEKLVNAAIDSGAVLHHLLK